MLPPQRVSYGRTRRRRNHQALKPLWPTMDPLSGTLKQHHRACQESGYVRPGLKITVPKLKIGVQRS
ncbi:50S ribosomal protein L32 [Leptolyngbya sp. 15MV]|nr:50S ribosomal protein L32 [Leptolyngbya sp. 15MV]